MLPAQLPVLWDWGRGATPPTPTAWCSGAAGAGLHHPPGTLGLGALRQPGGGGRRWWPCRVGLWALVGGEEPQAEGMGQARG